MKTAGKLFMICYRALAWVIIAAAALFVVLYFLGIRPYAVATGSMEPAIHQGSLCFINERTPFEEVTPGQVIAFKTGEMLVTHRAVRVENGSITTKGDANNTEDSAKVTRENYIGKNEAVIPFFGKIPIYVRTFSGKCVVIGAFSAFLLIGLLYDKIAAWVNKEHPKKENDSAAVSGESDTRGE